MRESILENKMILAVNDDPDVLRILEKEIRAACPNCTFDKATTYKEASEKMICLTYDVVLLGIIDERGLNLAELAGDRNFPLVLLAAHPLAPEGLKDYFKVKVHAYLPKERLRGIVPFIEEVLKYHYLPGWRRLFGRITGFLGKKIEIDRGKKLALSRRGWILSKQIGFGKVN